MVPSKSELDAQETGCEMLGLAWRGAFQIMLTPYDRSEMRSASLAHRFTTAPTPLALLAATDKRRDFWNSSMRRPAWRSSTA